ncbi:MAG: hypothetical protein PHU51_00815 [Candidatus Nanoarchaeia archaeon]|nr:hypothetical protein [Candidatus Nanoarchaeia archaeon]
MKIKLISFLMIMLLLMSNVFSAINPISSEIKGDKSFSYYTWTFENSPVRGYYLFQDGDHFLDVPEDDSFKNTFNLNFYDDAWTFAKGYTFVNMNKTEFRSGKTNFMSTEKTNEINQNEHSANHFRTYIYLSEADLVQFRVKHDDGLKIYVWNCGTGEFNENCKRTTAYDEVFAVKAIPKEDNVELRLNAGWNVIDFRHFNDYAYSYLTILNKNFEVEFWKNFDLSKLKYMNSEKPTEGEMCTLGLLEYGCTPDIEEIDEEDEEIIKEEPTPIINSTLEEFPICEKINTKSEGWYLNGELIKLDTCVCKAVCRYEGSKSEGFYNSCNGELIKYFMCRKEPEPTPAPTPTPAPKPKPKPIINENDRLPNDVDGDIVQENTNSITSIEELIINATDFEEVESIEETNINGEESLIIKGTVKEGFWIFTKNIEKTVIASKEQINSLK